MAGILFLLAIVAFLLVVAWAYRIERAGGAGGGEGLLGMIGEASARPARRARGPRFKRAVAATAVAEPAREAIRRGPMRGGRGVRAAAPRWRR